MLDFTDQLAAPIQVITALPNTEPASPVGWYGIVHVHYRQGDFEWRKVITVSHVDEGVADPWGNIGAALCMKFANEGNALNAALRLSKRIQSGEVSPVNGRPDK